MQLSRYRALLRMRQARALVLGAAISRQSTMLLLAQVLLVRQATNSYAAAGAATAAFALGQGLSAPVWGRLIDRHGPRRIVAALALLDGSALLMLVLAAEFGPTAWVLAALAGAAGLFGPPTVPAMRTMWSRLLADRGQRQAAYALEATLTELAFVLGPLATAGLATIASPGAAVLTGAAFLVGGSLLFALAAPSDYANPRYCVGALGAWRAPSLRLLFAVWFPLGASFTALEIVVPAYCQRDGATALAGVVLAAMAIGAVIGGLCYGALPLSSSLPQRFRRACLVFAVALIPTAASTSVIMLAALLSLAGAISAAVVTAASQWIDDFNAGATESFTWLLTAYMAGGALGAQTAGLAVSQLGLDWAMAAPAAFGLLAAGCAVVGTGQLQSGRAREALVARSSPA